MQNKELKRMNKLDVEFITMNSHKMSAKTPNEMVSRQAVNNKTRAALFKPASTENVKLYNRQYH